MANVPTQLSPGVNITEIDLSGIVREAGNNTSAFVGQFRWGPVSESLMVDSERRLTDIFLQPTNDLPEKMQDDFFTVANYFRYSDKLKIVRVIHETALNARSTVSLSGAVANPILIHNDEEFFAKADPTGVGAKNYDAVLSNISWVARYPGDLGNSLQVVAIGAGTFVQGNIDDPPDTTVPPAGTPPVVYNYDLPLISNGSLLAGVTYSIVTVPQITMIHDLIEGPLGITWANHFIGDGTTLPSGNTFGINYLCFFLRGSSYSANLGTFPIPGGSYSHIAGSNAAGGLTLSAYYRDRWMYGTFGTAKDNTDGNDWSVDGPLLAARLLTGVSFSQSGFTFGRIHVNGKGFHNNSSDELQSGNYCNVFVNNVIYTTNSVGEGANTYRKVVGAQQIFNHAAPEGWDNENDNPSFFERNPQSSEKRDSGASSVYYTKPSTHPINLHGVRPFTWEMTTFPSMVILPFDNTASALTEPISNRFVVNDELGVPDTDYYSYGGSIVINGLTAGRSVTRTADAYRNITTTKKVWKWSASGATIDASNEALFPLRRVVDSFPGITASGAKGMIVMMAMAQPVAGMTTGFHTLWHVGLTHGSTGYIAHNIGSYGGGITLNISNVDGAVANTALSNTIIGDVSNQNQLIYGISAEYDVSYGVGAYSTYTKYTTRGVGSAGDIDTARGVIVTTDPLDPNGDNNPHAHDKVGAQAQPFKQSDIATIYNLYITKADPAGEALPPAG